MKDSVVVDFNDPKSYEYVSMSFDTLRGKNFHSLNVDIYTSDITSIYKNQTKTITENPDFSSSEIETILKPGDILIEEFKRQRDSIRRNPIKPDSILQININVKCRVKNKMGALILDEIRLLYFPSTNKLRQSDNITDKSL